MTTPVVAGDDRAWTTPTVPPWRSASGALYGPDGDLLAMMKSRQMASKSGWRQRFLDKSQDTADGRSVRWRIAMPAPMKDGKASGLSGQIRAAPGNEAGKWTS